MEVTSRLDCAAEDGSAYHGRGWTPSCRIVVTDHSLAKQYGSDMSGKLTKAELSQEIARNCGASLKESKQLLEVIVDAMIRALSRGERIEIRGFGSFATRVRKPRVGRNPRTGAAVEVQAKRVPYFRPSKQLRAAL